MEQRKSTISCRGAVAVSTLLVAVAALAVRATPASAFGSSTPPQSPPSVNAGGYMTCGVRSAPGTADHLTAACWGENSTEGPGQSTPPAGIQFRVVNAGYNTACGVTIQDSVVCWGSNTNNKVSNVPNGAFTHVAPGFNFVCALRKPAAAAEHGTPVCWGADDAGQVSSTPEAEFTQLTVGIRHACGLTAPGGIVCWGANADKQLEVPPGTYRAVNSGNFTVCAIRSSDDPETDGSAVCWGRNQGSQAAPFPGPFEQVSAGFAHVCGLRPNNTVECWGNDAYGQSAAPAGTYNNVSAGTWHSCAMPTSGAEAVCWGLNASGRVQPNMRELPPPPGITRLPYMFAFSMTTHVSPAVTFSVAEGALPPGLTLDPSGSLTGTPTAGGTYTFTLSASNGLSPRGAPTVPTGDNAAFTATRTFTLTILSLPLPATT